MCPLDRRVCLSSGSQSLSGRPQLVTPASFTGLWKESSCDGENVGAALPAGKTEEERKKSVTWSMWSQIHIQLGDMEAVECMRRAVLTCGGENWYSKANSNGIISPERN